jgi:endonuclease G
MTNMMPQSPDNNQGPWEAFEAYCRTLVSSGNELYIIAGGSGSGGTGSNGGVTTTVASGHVGVPSKTWKVVLVLPNASGDDVARVTTSTRLIAVIMPNIQGIRANDWKSYRVSVNQVESLTGYDFFSNVPASIQSVIESTIDTQ